MIEIEHFEGINGLPQSIPLHHYEQFVDEEVVSLVREQILKKINESTFRKLFRDNCQQYQLFASELILEISRQQHQTAHFSISSITHKNALITLLAEQTVSVGTLLQNATPSEEYILLTELYPRLVAVLQMIHVKEAELPCFVETKNVLMELENGLFPLLQDIGLPRLLGRHLLHEPVEKKSYDIKVKKHNDIISYTGWLSSLKKKCSEEIAFKIIQNNALKTVLINVNDIEVVQSHIHVPAEQISLEEFYQMEQVGRWDTLLLYMQKRLKRNLTKPEQETLFKMTDDIELTYRIIQIIDGI